MMCTTQFVEKVINVLPKAGGQQRNVKTASGLDWKIALVNHLKCTTRQRHAKDFIEELTKIL